jgi:hypothetical protein
MIFATPDFGTSGSIACFLLLVWALVLAFAVWGVARGTQLLGGDSPQDKKRGILLLLVSGLVPFSCCVGPSQVIRLVYGNYPLGRYPDNKVKEGMTAEEVVAALATPHERYKEDDGESWYYWIDSWGLYWFCVRLGPDGRVISTHGN